MTIKITSVMESVEASQSDYDRVAQYQADMREWHARQERARQARLAFAKSCKPLGEPKWPTPRKTYNKAFYDSGFRMVIDGVPIRLAAHVEDWKKGNRDALGQGFDFYGLTIRPHGKGGFTDRPEPFPYWARHWQRRYITTEENGFLEFLNNRGGETLMTARKSYEYDKRREADRQSLGPNLFQAARLARHLAQPKAAT